MLFWIKWNWIFIILSSLRNIYSQEITSGCIAPSNPEKGNYFINKTKIAVGEIVNQYSILTYECDDMYTKSGSQNIYCGANGMWIGSMECSKKCELPYSLTLDFTCSLNGNYKVCRKIMDHGTIVNPKCKPLHIPNKNQYLNAVTCNNGRWTDEFRECSTDCGKENGLVVPFIFNGEVEERGSSPWHVGIYQLRDQDYEHICGGTIVSRKFVITAAHCLLYTPYENFYAVAAGKIYRKWNHRENEEFPYIQRKMIEKVNIPKTYIGFDNNLEDDIAVIVVRTPFDFYNEVHAACLADKDRDLTTYLSHNNGGKIVGWGVTKEGDIFSTSDELLKADVEIIDRDECIGNVPREFIKFVSPTKYCVKGINNMTVCNGDSGGGVLVRVPDSGVFRWHLTGIVSVGILNALRTTCQTNTHTAITSLQSYTKFITKAFKSNDCLLLDGTPGVCKSSDQCTKAREQLEKEGITPTICSSTDSPTTVCCPYEAEAFTKTKFNSRQRLTSNYTECQYPKEAITVNKTGQKAWDKCIDLADSVFPCLPLDPNVSTPKIRMDTCRHTGVELILGGTATKPGEFPHMAAVGYKNMSMDVIEWICGGSLISEQWVLTTSYCIRARLIIRRYVRLGGEGVSSASNPEFLFSVIYHEKHPEAMNFYNDIGLLKLDRKVKFSAKIRPACLHVGNQVNERKAIATGWGTTENRTKSATLLKCQQDKRVHLVTPVAEVVDRCSISA
ncbi:modular serine protease-like isoform X2 [Arctopsyche grandis]|uniref:modular serine protease-like isoform X2 n=1 Tax=Arctopsyche grandis TaxID=121162 RepID=UPI00406D8B72